MRNDVLSIEKTRTFTLCLPKHPKVNRLQVPGPIFPVYWLFFLGCLPYLALNLSIDHADAAGDEPGAAAGRAVQGDQEERRVAQPAVRAQPVRRHVPPHQAPEVQVRCGWVAGCISNHGLICTVFRHKAPEVQVRCVWVAFPTMVLLAPSVFGHKAPEVQVHCCAWVAGCIFQPWFYLHRLS